MKKTAGHGWQRPGMNSSDYGLSFGHDHDYRTYSGMDFSGVGPSQYRRPDHLVEEDICELLKWDTEVDASDIEVFVLDGLVTLKGTVDNRHAKLKAEILANDVRGVIDVKNRIFIKKYFDLDPDKIMARGPDGLFSQEIIPR